MIAVFLITALALFLFATELIPVDITAILVLVLLVAFEPWTQVSPAQGVSGFANPATITILAMFVLSEGVRRTGLLRALGRKVAQLTGDNETKQLAATIGMAGSTAGFINNTPVVAMLIPVVTDLAERTNTSPSKLLMPLSYAAILGGTLTVIGTSATLVASDLTDQLLDRGPIGMFEFTPLGVLVLIAGAAYLLTAGRYLLPERIEPGSNLIQQFELTDYLTELVIRPGAPFVGKTVQEAVEETQLDMLVVQILRDGRVLSAPLGRRVLREGDILRIRTDRNTMMELVELGGVEFASSPEADASPPEGLEEQLTLVEAIVLPDTPLVGKSLATLRFRQRYDSTVLAIRRNGHLINQSLSDISLRGGDTLLVQTTEDAARWLGNNRYFVVTEEIARPDFRADKGPIAVGIVAAVVLIAALGILPIMVTALAGIVAMVLSGCLKPTELYEAVDWNVIVLLAGIIPLGIALEKTGGAAFLATLVAPLTSVVPMLLFALLFYLLTTVITELITNLGSIILMVPIAIDIALQTGSNPFSFILLVAFASSCSLMTPVGYQTNLMVFNRGGYRFTDFLRVGAPLQLLLASVTTIGIAALWGFR